ncbi:MAG TPA: inorganic diphosphatase [Myxococcales bacterium]|nr:inorganic diphosphatase [Myxococcales bacterium]
MQLHKLSPRDSDAAVRVVVEAPRGCGVKLKYQPRLGAFEYGRALPLGLSYPYDWGFVPGTRAEDGDPLDALVLCDVPSYPGVVIPSRPIGAVLVDQKNEEGERERNDRLVLVPVGAERFAELREARALPRRAREEIERFFLDTTFFMQKDARVLGWKGAAEADALVRKSAAAARRRR